MMDDDLELPSTSRSPSSLPPMQEEEHSVILVLLDDDEEDEDKKEDHGKIYVNKKHRHDKRTVTSRDASLGYMHLTDEQFYALNVSLALDEAKRHVLVTDFCTALSFVMFLIPLVQSALLFQMGTHATFYEEFGDHVAVAIVGVVVLAVLYDCHSSLFLFVGRMTLSLKLLNWIWIVFILALPVGSMIILDHVHGTFGYLVIMLSARFVTATLVWAIRSQPATWKYDVAPRFHFMIRSLVDFFLLMGGMFVSMTMLGYWSALFILAGPVITRVLLEVFPSLNFD